jgi:26S proteasome non-ATPase regulatory subunit 10
MICVNVGDAAVALLKAGADATIKNSAEELALDLAPDKEVSTPATQSQ